MFKGILLCVLLAGTAALSVAEQASLVLHYDCNEIDGRQIRDQSGNQLDAACSNVDLVDGVLGKAIAADGDGVLVLPHNSIIPQGGDFSISVWLKISGMGEKFANVLKKDGPDRNCVIFITKGGTPIWSAGYVGSVKPIDNVPAPAVLSDDQWHHLAYVHAGSRKTLSVYFDGQLIKEASLPGGALKTNEASWRFLEGVVGGMDELKVYRGLLSAEDVQAEFRHAESRDSLKSDEDDVPSWLEVSGWTDVSYTEPVTPDMVVEDFDAACEKAVAGIQRCRQRIAELTAENLWTGYEQLSLSIAEKFIDYARSDREHIAENAGVFFKWGWWEFKMEDATAFAERLPRQEMKQVLDLIAQVEQSLANESVLKARPHPPVEELDARQFQLDGSYLTQNGHVIFPHGFNKVTEKSEAIQVSEWGGVLVDVPFKFGEMFPNGPDQVNERAVDAGVAKVKFCLERGLVPNVRFAFILPDWVKERFPETLEAGGQFMPLDIDHPITREFAARMVGEVLKKMPDSRMILYKIGNEISYPLPVKTTLGDDWEIKTPSVSKYGWDKFAIYLKKQYLNIEDLNQRWGTRHAGFTAAAHAPVSPQNQAAFYDACRFNEERVLDFYRQLHDQIKRSHPEGVVHVNHAGGKLMTGSCTAATQIAGKFRNVSDYMSGISLENFNRMNDIVAFDTTAMRLPPYRYFHPKYKFDRYAFEWMGLAMIYDYQRSISQGKLLYENELHSQQIVGGRDDRMPPDHLRCVSWMQAALGMGMNRIWMWGRNGDELEYRHARAMYCSTSQFPLLVDSFLRTAMELNAAAPEIVALAQSSKPVAMLFSDASAMQDVEYLDTQMATYEALCFLGQGIDFVTEDQVKDGGLEKYSLLVVGGARHVESSTLEAMSRFLTSGGHLLRIGEQTLDLDPWGHPHDTSFTGGKKLTFETVAELHGQLQEQFASFGMTPALQVKKTGASDSLGLFHRSMEKDGERYLFVAQIGSSPVEVSVEDQGEALSSAVNVLTGQDENLDGLVLQPWDVRLWKIGTAPAEDLETSAFRKFFHMF